MTEPCPIEIKRHHQTLSEKETGELVGTVADMLVAFVKNHKPGLGPPGSDPLCPSTPLGKEKL